jgi:Ca2+/H+ antiporter
VLSSTTRRPHHRRVVDRREGLQSQRLLAPLLLLGPALVVLDRLDAAGAMTLFVLAAAALVPLAWLIGEATDIISWGFQPLALSFRAIELVAMGVAAALPALVLRAGRTTSIGGAILLAAYTVFGVAFYLSGDD